MNFMKLIFLMTCIFSAKSFAEEKPPKVYIESDRCSYEQKWKAEKDVLLFDKIGGRKKTGVVKKGETVTTLAGERHIVPTPMKVVFQHGDYKVGDQVYLLTPLEEGEQKVWWKGRVITEDVNFLYDTEHNGTCSPPAEKCWGRILGEQSEQRWVKIKQNNGSIGWTKAISDFDNSDLCN